jgi:hypothetical protein
MENLLFYSRIWGKIEARAGSLEHMDSSIWKFGTHASAVSDFPWETRTGCKFVRPSATQLRGVLPQFQLGQKYSTLLMLVALQVVRGSRRGERSLIWNATVARTGLQLFRTYVWRKAMGEIARGREIARLVRLEQEQLASWIFAAPICFELPGLAVPAEANSNVCPRWGCP